MSEPPDSLIYIDQIVAGLEAHCECDRVPESKIEFGQDSRIFFDVSKYFKNTIDFEGAEKDAHDGERLVSLGAQKECCRLKLVGRGAETYQLEYVLALWVVEPPKDNKTRASVLWEALRRALASPG